MSGAEAGSVVAGRAALAGGLHFRPLALLAEALLALTLARPRCAARLRAVRRLLDEGDEPGTGRLAVHRLRAVLAAVDHQDAFGREPLAGERDQPRLHLGRQRRPVDVEPQLHRRRHLVDVLSARTRGADEALLDLALVERQRRRDLQHDGPALSVRSGSARRARARTWCPSPRCPPKSAPAPTAW